MLAFRLLEVRNGSSVWISHPSANAVHTAKSQRFRLTAPYSEERRRAASKAAKKHSGNLTRTIQKDVV